MLLLPFALLALVANGQDWLQDFKDHYVPLWKVYGEIDPATALKNRQERESRYNPTPAPTTTSTMYWQSRNASRVHPLPHRRPPAAPSPRGNLLRGAVPADASRDIDVFCNNRTVDILILQDATGSLQKVIDITSERTLSEIDADITPNFDVSYSVTSFRDKPIPNLGDDTDDCHIPGLFKLPTAESLKPFFDDLDAGGGRDIPENQYGAIQAAIRSPKTIPWTRSDNSVKLILLVTDAPPHFEGDSSQSSHPDLSPFGSKYDENKYDEFCTQKYYPSPDDIKNVILDNEVYLAVIIPDTKLVFDTAVASWQWVMQHVGFPVDYVETMIEGNFSWAQALRDIIDNIYTEECPSTTSTSTTTPHKSTTKRPNYCHRKHH